MRGSFYCPHPPRQGIGGWAGAGIKRAPGVVPGAVGCGLELGCGGFVADYGYVRMGLED